MHPHKSLSSFSHHILHQGIFDLGEIPDYIFARCNENEYSNVILREAYVVFV